jgi:hypothetical protein
MIYDYVYDMHYHVGHPPEEQEHLSIDLRIEILFQMLHAGYRLVQDPYAINICPTTANPPIAGVT